MSNTTSTEKVKTNDKLEHKQGVSVILGIIGFFILLIASILANSFVIVDIFSQLTTVIAIALTFLVGLALFIGAVYWYHTLEDKKKGK